MLKHIKVVAGVLALTLVFSGGLAIGRANIDVTAPVTASAYTYDIFDYNIVDGEIQLTACDRTATDVVIPSEIDGMPVTDIGAYTFLNRDKLESVTIPEGVKVIGEGAFEGCTSLKSVTIPDSVTNIVKSAFNSCTALESVNIGKNTVTIGDSAFAGCTSLESIVLPDSLKSVKYLAFANCEKLSDITIPESLEDFGLGIFNNTPWLEAKATENPLVIVNDIVIDGYRCKGDVIIPDGVKAIRGSGFDSNSNITSVTIPDSVTDIGEYAFYNCDKLTSITIPASVETIGINALNDCEYLGIVTILNPDCDIYDYARIFGSAIINAPENSTAQAFAEKYDLRFIALGEELPEIPDPPKPIKKGDINGDGYVDPIDATIILNYYSYLSTTTDNPVMDIDEYQAAQE